MGNRHRVAAKRRQSVRLLLERMTTNAGTDEVSIQIRPACWLDPHQEMNPKQEGVHITVTGFVRQAAVDVSVVIRWIEYVSQDLHRRHATAWTPDSEGALAPPQPDSTRSDLWYLNLCGSQGTLGTVSALALDYYRALYPLSDDLWPWTRSNKECLGWHMTLQNRQNPIVPRQAREDWRTVRDIDAWALCLVQRDRAGKVKTIYTAHKILHAPRCGLPGIVPRNPIAARVCCHVPCCSPKAHCGCCQGPCGEECSGCTQPGASCCHSCDNPGPVETAFRPCAECPREYGAVRTTAECHAQSRPRRRWAVMACCYRVQQYPLARWHAN